MGNVEFQNDIWTGTDPERIPTVSTTLTNIAQFKNDIENNLLCGNIFFSDLNSKLQIATGQLFNLVNYGIAEEPCVPLPTAFLNAQINIAAVGGGEIVIPQGVWEVPSQMTVLFNNITVRGQGIGVTVLRVKDDTDPGLAALAVGRGSDDTKPQNVVIRDLTIDGNVDTLSGSTDTYSGIYAPLFKNLTLVNVEVKNCGRSGIQVGSSDTSTTDLAEELIVQNCLVDNVGYSGIEVEGVHDCTITGCRITRTGYHGIDIGGDETLGTPRYSERVLVANNTVLRNTAPTHTYSALSYVDGALLALDEARFGVKIHGNILWSLNGNGASSTSPGIQTTKDTLDANINGNTVTGSKGYGIMVPTQGIVSNNRVVSAGTTGIYIGTAATAGNHTIRDVTVTGNTIEEPNEINEPSTVANAGIEVSATAANTIRRIVISSNLIADGRGTPITKYGIHLDYTNATITDITVSGNEARTLAAASATDGHSLHITGGSGSLAFLRMGIDNNFRDSQGAWGTDNLTAGSLTTSLSNFYPASLDLKVEGCRQETGGTLGHLNFGYNAAGPALNISSSSGTDTSKVVWRVTGTDD